MKQQLIAIDQVLNTLVYIPNDGWGYADETLSARAWRLSATSEYARYTRIAIDILFFFDPDHCRTSYLSEVERKHLPVEYRNGLNNTKNRASK